MNTDQLIRLHNTIQYFEAIGCWGLAEAFRKIILKEIENEYFI